ncbi:MAG TPA: hypothetical protein VD861_09075 [Pyrinomonadaceae bacterium]|nr:hypothetical protein [Pyrinomonadaceae bacterium]
MARLGRRKKDDIHETPDVSHIQNPDVSHEASDVNVGSIAKFVIGLFVLTVITFVLMKLLFKVLEDRAAKLDPPPRPMALTEQERLPPEPRLQAAPGFGVDEGPNKRVNLQLREPQAEYNVLRKVWDEVLAGKPDPRTGKMGMPIDEAMRRVVEDGSLRSRPPGDNQEQIDLNGMNIPSYQSSGRMMEKRDQ